MRSILLTGLLLLPGFLHAMDWQIRQVNSTRYNATDIIAVDIDDDGDQDLLSADVFMNATHWWENLDGTGVNWECHEIAQSQGLRFIRSGDMDGDGDVDVVGACEHPGNIFWWENTDGTGGEWTEHLVGSDSESSAGVYAVDIDGDLDEDIISYCWRDTTLLWWENADGSGEEWTIHDIPGNHFRLETLSFTDLDGDGDTDIVKGDFNEADFVWIENINGVGTEWVEQEISEDQGGTTGISTADINADGFEDIICSAYHLEDLVWWENTNGTGDSWDLHIVDDNIVRLVHTKTADLDEDGDLDIVGASWEEDELNDDVAWWENVDGIGETWVKHVVPHGGTRSGRLDIADMNGDNILDIVATANWMDCIYWWEQVDFLPIVLETPNGGENWPVGTEQLIAWEQVVDEPVAIDLYLRDTLFQTIVTDLEDCLEYLWTVQPVPTQNQYRINVNTMIDGIPYFDYSESKFEISNPIDLTHPSGEENLRLGSTQVITWESPVETPITIELYWFEDLQEVLAENIENDGEFEWIIPQLPHDDHYKIRISTTVLGQEYYDESRYFGLLPPIELTTPNGGEQWRVGETHSIEWEYGPENPVTICLYSNEELVSTIASNEQNDGEFSWNIMNLPVADNYRIVLQTTFDSQEFFDTSDSNFSILSPVELLSPQSNEVLIIGIPYTITWQSTLDIPVTLTLYRDSEYVRTIALQTENDGEFQWIVPQILPSEQYRVRVSLQSGDIQYEDYGNSLFSITTPMIVFEELYADTVHPSYVSTIFRLYQRDGIGIPYLDDLEYYQFLEDGQPLPESESFLEMGQRDEYPYSQKTILMLDNSASMDLSALQEAASSLIRGIFPDQEAAIWTFGESVQEVQPFSSDTTVLLTSINEMTLVSEATDLHGAIVTAIEQWTDS